MKLGDQQLTIVNIVILQIQSFHVSGILIIWIRKKKEEELFNVLKIRIYN
jgi:hypothetical protein